ncbi:MAG TPA: DUF853 domain-containing protein, partial [Thermoanaerobaculia bacterium]|nr:DUF853 domain-containing protein [Thermoanaerobaculia bacterium]
SGEALPPAKQRVLNALAFLEGIGLPSADRSQLALLAKASPTSSAFANNLGALRTAGLIDYPGQSRVALTPDGRAIASTEDVPQTSEELHAELQRILPPAKWRIVAPLIETYPNALDKVTLAEAAGASPTSSAYANNLGSLRTLGVIDYPRQGEVIASPVLFLEGR